MAGTRLRSLCRRVPPQLTPPFRAKIGQFPAQREGWDRDMACGSCAYIARVRRQSLAAFFFRDLGDDARKSLPDDARWVYID